MPNCHIVWPDFTLDSASSFHLIISKITLNESSYHVLNVLLNVVNACEVQLSSVDVTEAHGDMKCKYKPPECLVQTSATILVE